MPIGSVWGSGTWEDTAWEDGSWADSTPPEPAEFTWTLHAGTTNTLLHAEATAGEVNMIKHAYTLIDEDGNILVDEDGNILVSSLDDLSVIVLHARPTNTLLHAEDLHG